MIFPSQLDVFIAGTHCGTLSEDRHGAISFVYDAGYESVPLSMSMPVGLARYGDRAVRPYLLGLLPDNESTRVAIGAPFGISGDNPFRLLSVVGLDCPGAVQLCAPDVGPADSQFPSDLVELSEGQMSAKLHSVREDAAVAWGGSDGSEGRWSLGGCQAKFAVRYQEGRWFECRGASATTHIVKPGVVGYDHQALVEYVSMKVARAIGLPAARVTYRCFGNEPAIVIERYDRTVDAGGDVRRIHQEDFCQALSVSPAAKYADQGGPTTPQIIALLGKTGSNARENIYRFILYLFFNYLIGATDAHAKNHSLLFEARDDIRIAPLYDVASMAPYRTLSPKKRKPLRAALSIGGENRFGMVGSEQVVKMVATCGLEKWRLDSKLLIQRFRSMAQAVPDGLDEVISEAEAQGIPGIEVIAPAMRSEIGAHCRKTLEMLA